MEVWLRSSELRRHLLARLHILEVATQVSKYLSSSLDQQYRLHRQKVTQPLQKTVRWLLATRQLHLNCSIPSFLSHIRQRSSLRLQMQRLQTHLQRLSVNPLRLLCSQEMLVLPMQSLVYFQLILP